MENILLAIDGTRLSMNSIDFACYIANLTHSRLSAVFVENIVGEEAPQLKELFALPYVESITAGDLPENREKEKSSEQHAQIFREACENRGVNCRVHIQKHAVIRDIILESRFADLVIVDPESSFNGPGGSAPSRFIREILAAAECPVIIAPYSFSSIDEIVFAYDGSKSSVFSIKQFMHLFPGLGNKQVTVLQVSEKKILPFKNADKIEDLLESHYAKVDYRHLQGKPSDELFGYLLKKQNSFVVMGAYGRGILSSLFRPSTAELVMETVNLPIFIAHC